MWNPSQQIFKLNEDQDGDHDFQIKYDSLNTSKALVYDLLLRPRVTFWTSAKTLGWDLKLVLADGYKVVFDSVNRSNTVFKKKSSHFPRFCKSNGNICF